jgi:hypothetical protein
MSTHTAASRRWRGASSLLAAPFCALAVSLVTAGPAWAAAPRVETGAPYSTNPHSAIVIGIVFPGGSKTEYWVEYARVAGGTQGEREFCEEKSKTGAHETSPPGELEGAVIAELVSIELPALVAGAEYCARLVAKNEQGTAPTAPGELELFVAGAPSAETGPAVSTTTTTATVEALLDGAGQPTMYELEYGIASSEWCTTEGRAGRPENVTSRAELGFVDGVFHEVEINVRGLSPGSRYCDEVVASNGSATEHGGQNAFTTLPVRTLTVSIADAGSGSGTVSGNGISCPGTCSNAYPPGTRVTLSATPAPGSTFKGWAGVCTGTGSCTVTMGANHTVGAAFFAPTPAPPSAPATKPPVEKGRPVANAKNGEVEVEYEFPEPGRAESFGEVMHGATLASAGRFAARSAKARKCAKGDVRRGKRCVSDAPARYGQRVLTIAAAGRYKLHVKPSGKVLAALQKGRTLTIRVDLIFTPAGTTARLTASSTVSVRLKRRRRPRGGSHRP